MNEHTALEAPLVQEGDPLRLYIAQLHEENAQTKDSEIKTRASTATACYTLCGGAAAGSPFTFGLSLLAMPVAAGVILGGFKKADNYHKLNNIQKTTDDYLQEVNTQLTDGRLRGIPFVVFGEALAEKGLSESQYSPTHKQYEIIQMFDELLIAHRTGVVTDEIATQFHNGFKGVLIANITEKGILGQAGNLAKFHNPSFTKAPNPLNNEYKNCRKIQHVSHTAGGEGETEVVQDSNFNKYATVTDTVIPTLLEAEITKRSETRLAQLKQHTGQFLAKNLPEEISYTGCGTIDMQRQTLAVIEPLVHEVMWRNEGEALESYSGLNNRGQGTVVRTMRELLDEQKQTDRWGMTTGYNIDNEPFKAEFKEVLGKEISDLSKRKATTKTPGNWSVNDSFASYFEAKPTIANFPGRIVSVITDTAKRTAFQEAITTLVGEVMDNDTTTKFNLLNKTGCARLVTALKEYVKENAEFKNIHENEGLGTEFKRILKDNIEAMSKRTVTLGACRLEEEGVSGMHNR